jgi:small subunit ribosomal protein S16
MNLNISVILYAYMLKIRLKRVGRKHDPSFRVVLVDSHKGPKTGKVNENLGFYDPKKDIKDLKAESIKDWISKGAQVSDTVHNLLVDQKIIEGKKVNVLPKKSPIIKEKVETDDKPKTKESNDQPKTDTQSEEPSKKEVEGKSEEGTPEEVKEDSVESQSMTEEVGAPKKEA